MQLCGGQLPGRQFCLMLVCAGSAPQWDNKKYKNIKYLQIALEETSIVDELHSSQDLQTNLRKTLDLYRILTCIPLNG